MCGIQRWGVVMDYQFIVQLGDGAVVVVTRTVSVTLWRVGVSLPCILRGWLICIESISMNSQGRLVGHIRNVRAL